ncbi:MAG: flagellar biosynthetic protein FliO [Anaerolineaceae bacterium]|nr:flagellar biosynthetic protein FliO [Anaerolineaceae bacterium]
MIERIKKTLLENARNRKILITIGWVSIVLMILIYAAGMSGVAPDTNTDALTSTTEFNIGEMVFGTIIRLFLVLALIYGVFSIYRLLQKGSAKINKRRIQIIDTHRFSAKQAIVILRIDGKELLIGLTDHQISVLNILESKENSDENVPIEQVNTTETFQHILDMKNEKE